LIGIPELYFSIAKRTMFSIYEVLPGIDVAFTERWQLQLRRRASSLTTVLINGLGKGTASQVVEELSF
jgi:hypothetical protein